MRRHARTGVMVVIVVMLAAVSASAQEEKSYFTFKGGYFAPTGGGFQNTDMSGNAYWEVASGTDYSFFGVEFGIGYLQSRNDNVDVYTVPVTLSAKVQFPIALFVPYLKAGGGIFFTDGSSRVGQGSDSAWNWGYQAGGGIDFRLDWLILGVEVKYIAVDANLKMGDVKLEGVITTGNIGFRF